MIIALFTAGQAVMAELVCDSQVRATARRWIQTSPVFQAAAASLSAGTAFQVVGVWPVELEPGEKPLAYHVGLTPRGYLLIGADDRLPPVLAFSADRELKLDSGDQNAFRAMLAADLRAAREALGAMDANRRTAAADGFPERARRHQAEWAALAAAVRTGSSPVVTSDAAPTNVLVTPMLATTWSQWRHFNEAYPDDPQPGSGYNGKAPVGCVALAGAQLAKFYAWPPRGRESYTDIDANTNNFISGSFTAAFLDRFDWKKMQDSYDPWSSEPAAAVAAVSALIYRLGVSADTDVGSFSAGGSSAYLASLNRALSRYFFYDLGTVLQRTGNEAGFDAQLRAQILAGRPVPASIPTHAMIVDGLSAETGADYFHVNYGWGGANDGWYRLSDIAGSSLTEAIVGLQPRFIPVPDGAGTLTNNSGSFSLGWTMPANRRPAAERYRVREGVFSAADFDDEATDFALWHNDSGGWMLDAVTNGGVTTCFRKAGELGCFELVSREVFRVHANSRLTFRCRTSLLDDRFLVKLSADGGATWVTVADYTNTGWASNWRNENIDLSSFASREVMLSFEYVFRGGRYYGQTGSVWVDRISLRNVDRLSWVTLADNVTTNVCAISGRTDGTYYFAVDAYDGTAWSESSPITSVGVALDPALDADADGMPNGWETTYFGSATGGVAAADADGDGMSNWSESQAGTNPTNASDRLAMRTEPPSPGGLTVTWSSVAGKRYTVLRADALHVPAVFAVLEPGIDATPPQNRYTDPAGAALSAAFYRVRVERP